MQQRGYAQGERCQEKQRSEAKQELSVGSLCDGVGGEARRQYCLNLCPDLDCSAQLGMRRSSEATYQGADQLKAEHGQNKQNGHDFPSAALGQPAFEPGEHRLHQHEIEQCEGEQD